MTAGRAVREYLTDHVTLLRMHRLGPEGIALGDIEVPLMAVWFRADAPPPGHRGIVTRGADATHPEEECSLGVGVLRG